MSSITEMLDNINETPFEGNQDFQLELPAEELTRQAEISQASIEDILADRGKTHGDYADHARITRRLKDTVIIELVRRKQRGQPRLTDTQLESIDMIMHKVGRIIAGESGFQDHWLDIAGYANIARADV